MMRRYLLATLATAALAIATAAVPAGQPSQASCASLLSAHLPDTTIKAAEEVAGPSFTPGTGAAISNLPAFCRVVGVTKPAVPSRCGSRSRLERQVPGRRQRRERRRDQLRRDGHGDAPRLRDGEHRHRPREHQLPRCVVGDGASRTASPISAIAAIHVTAENGKKIVRSFYGQPAKRSYFVACSTGGRQGLMEAQRFPEDYDGIVAGAPAANWTRFQTGGHLWAVLALNKDPESYMPASKLPLLADAVNAACDAIDGIADGVLDDPRQLQVRSADAASASRRRIPRRCLTAEAGQGGRRISGRARKTRRASRSIPATCAVPKRRRRLGRLHDRQRAAAPATTGISPTTC